MMEAATTYDTSVKCKTTLRNFPENGQILSAFVKTGHRWELQVTSPCL
jgi:hypothetical protein